MSVLVVGMISHSLVSLYVYCFDIGVNVSVTCSLFVPSLFCTAVVVNLVPVLYWC